MSFKMCSFIHILIYFPQYKKMNSETGKEMSCNNQVTALNFHNKLQINID